MPPVLLSTDVLGARVWLLDLAAEPEADAWSACQPEEQARAARFKFDVHARRYRAAHAAMRLCMADQLGLAPERWRWVPGVHGKPHHVDVGANANANAAAATLGHFNLSHSDDWALLAWHPQQPVGVDIEWHLPLPDVDGLAVQQFTVAEQAWVRDAPAGEAREDRFYRLWAAKEAALKALGSGLIVAPQRVEVDLTRSTCDTQIVLGPDDGHSPHTPCRLQVSELPLPEALRARAALAVVHPDDAALAF
jgi:4'-phosphopantetheinyl transferase